MKRTTQILIAMTTVLAGFAAFASIVTRAPASVLDDAGLDAGGGPEGGGLDAGSDGCSDEIVDACSGMGSPGCGGFGGLGGGGGQGGGAAIALMAVNTQVVMTNGGLFVGNGGAGGQGGGGGAGANGSQGNAGSSIGCSSQLKCNGGCADFEIEGGAGGQGAQGGSGGQGGGGAGGPTYFYVQLGDASVSASSSTQMVVETDGGGLGGPPNGPNGARGQKYP